MAIQAPKFYRYFFYRQYVISKIWGSTEPAMSSVAVSAVNLMFHGTFVIVCTGEILNINVIDFLFTNRGPLEIIGYSIFFMVLAYFLFYYDGKWSKIVGEFQDESEKQQILGKYALIL